MSSTYYNKLISVVLDPTKKQDDNPFTLNTKKYSLVLFDVTNSKIIKQSPINLFPHDIIRLNRSSDKVLMIEKWGSKICSYDITKNRTMKFRDITEEKHSGPKYVPSLMGHGQVAGTDKFIYTTEIIVDDRNLNSSLDFKLFGNGFVSVRNTDSLQTVKRISTFGKIPHDCILLDDQKTLAVLNSGTEYMVERKIVNYDPKLNLSSLVFIDLESGKLIKKILLKNTPHIRPVHMKRTKDGDFIIIGKPNLSRRKTYRRKDQSVLVLKDQKTFYPIAIPLELRGRLTHEMLSMELDKHRSIVGVTSP
ncbi:MAG: DUF1513 domain-containing protein, partial [Candidatus Brocadiales bacterium]|nr:DUF1513 domain-containing protein [Candidatus Brocadiales bacterium]